MCFSNMITDLFLIGLSAHSSQRMDANSSSVLESVHNVLYLDQFRFGY